MTTPAPAPIQPELPETELAQVKPIRGRFDRQNVFDTLRNFYDESQIKLMQERGVDSRMVFGINSYYMALVKGEGLNDAAGNIILPAMPPSVALQHLVVPVVAEAMDKSGEKDPSNQIRYSPGTLKGKILHKYGEIVLAYAAMACSAHCRYCYRLDLFNGSTGKGLVKAEELRQYIIDYNKSVAENPAHPETGETRHPVREVLLSGGDPMVLSNKQLYKYMAAAAEAGINMIRLGTKEMAFRPMRFDENLAETFRIFHANYPNVHINVVVHFTHPDEFLERDETGAYKKANDGHYVWLDAVKKAVTNMASLSFVSLDNQTPIILHVNNDAKIMHMLHAELRRMNIKPKYIFQCREIEGHKAFAVPVEEAWRIHTASQQGLSDACRSRFAMSTEWGKLEVVSVIDAMPKALIESLPEEIAAPLARLFGDGLVVFKMHRSPYSADTQSDLVIARRNEKALWLTEYEDRIIYDGRNSGDAKYAAMAKMLSSLIPQDTLDQLSKILAAA